MSRSTQTANETGTRASTGLRFLRLRKAQVSMFGAVRAVAPAHHEPLQEHDDLVLLRSPKNPKVRRWQHRERQRGLFQADQSERFLRELEKAGRPIGLSRARAEAPHIHHLFVQGLIKIKTLPKHHITPFQAELTEAGRRYLRTMAERDRSRQQQAQRHLFKASGALAGTTMRIIRLAKAPRKAQAGIPGIREKYNAAIEKAHGIGATAEAERLTRLRDKHTDAPGPKEGVGEKHEVGMHFRRTKTGKTTIVHEHQRAGTGHQVEAPAQKKKKAEPAAPPPPTEVVGGAERTFEVPTDKLDDLRDQFAALARRAARLGVEAPTLDIGAKTTLRQSWKVSKGGVDGPPSRRKGPMVQTVTVTVRGPAVKLQGWNVAAMVEPKSKGNVLVRRLGSYQGAEGVKVPAKYDHGDSCEHCQTARQRKKLFVIHNPATNEWKRVGGECVKDHTGRDADGLVASVAFCDEFLDGFDEFGFDEESGGGGGRRGTFYPRERALAWGLRAGHEIGMISRKAANESGVLSTGDVARDYAIEGARVRPEDKARAQEVAGFWATVKESELAGNDFLRNVWVLMQEEHISFRDIPLFAWSRKAMERVQENRQRLADQAKAAATAPPPLGKPGDKIRGGKVSAADRKAGVEYHPPRVVVVDRTHVHAGDYGSVTFMTMHDADGHTFEWAASGTAKAMPLPPGPDGQDFGQWYFDLDRSGVQYLVRSASIDSHGEYKGQNRTKVKRVDLVPYYKDVDEFIQAANHDAEGFRFVPLDVARDLNDEKDAAWRKERANLEKEHPTLPYHILDAASAVLREKHDAKVAKIERAFMKDVYERTYKPLIAGFEPLLKGRRRRLVMRVRCGMAS